MIWEVSPDQRLPSNAGAYPVRDNSEQVTVQHVVVLIRTSSLMTWLSMQVHPWKSRQLPALKLPPLGRFPNAGLKAL
ncbi:MAG: hypothetical protein IPJ06_19540 [Saprospiraceae bacterium]|nr:hypothetical protein [Saprospiraceae bacterium]